MLEASCRNLTGQTTCAPAAIRPAVHNSTQQPAGLLCTVVYSQRPGTTVPSGQLCTASGWFCTWPASLATGPTAYCRALFWDPFEPLPT
ncbi:hypothetical protein MRB53_034576 [Persea americana]|uniref:Uncharacterized protein n=1 Tax=Persea americana TaxID=3435 RepID=A0ACC2K279_PERAE|nr:hypothetical protein MRB53_034576 [Persea americana]